jgi:flagellin
MQYFHGRNVFKVIIKHDVTSIFQQRQLKVNNMEGDKILEKLSSGLRINKAGDDASGLAVSEHMRSQIKGLNRANLNAQDGISLIETTDGHLSGITSMLQRIRELAVQASNGIYTSEDRLQIQIEVSSLIDEIDRVASHAQFNGLTMLTGRFSEAIEGEHVYGSMWFHIGANMDQRERVVISTITAKALGLKYFGGDVLSISTADKANFAIGAIDNALMKVNKQRADLGAYYNRMLYTSKGLMITSENTQAAESAIRDADMAKETVNYLKHQILTQSNLNVIQRNNIIKNDSLIYLIMKNR